MEAGLSKTDVWLDVHPGSIDRNVFPNNPLKMMNAHVRGERRKTSLVARATVTDALLLGNVVAVFSWVSLLIFFRV